MKIGNQAGGNVRGMGLLAYVMVGLIVFGAQLFGLDEQPAIELEMSPEIFNASGLSKLTASELKVLNQWLDQNYLKHSEPVRVIREAEPARGEDAFGLEDVRKHTEDFSPPSAPEEIVSTIAGEFRGWKGRTTFNLENGQVWRQVENGRFVVNMQDPTVVIKRGSFGSYFLSIEGYGTRIKVVRLN